MRQLSHLTQIHSTVSKKRLRLGAFFFSFIESAFFSRELFPVYEWRVYDLSALEATYIKVSQPILCRQKEFVYALKISY